MLQAIAVAGLAASKFADFFDKWIPGIVWKYQVKAQGGPATPNRAVLHAALAAVFGMANQKTFSTIELTANVDHNNNTVIVTYSIIVNGTTEVINKILKGVLKDLTLPPKKNVPNNVKEGVNQNNSFDGEDAMNYADIVGGIALRLGTSYIYGKEDFKSGREWIMRKIRETVEQGKDFGRFVAGVAITGDSKEAARFAARKGEEAKRKVDPNLLPKIPPDPNVDRGLQNGVKPDNPALPWIVSRQVESVLGLPSVKQVLAEQVIRQKYETAAGSVFDLSSDNIYAGDMPEILKIGQAAGLNPEPFDTMAVAHGRANGTPFLTRDADINPQLPQAMGVDLKTLVAQVLFDPGTWPPQPKTEQGPPTIVSDNYPQFPS